MGFRRMSQSSILNPDERGTAVKQGFLFTHRSRDRQEPALITVINLNLSERAEHEGAERRRERGTAEEKE